LRARRGGQYEYSQNPGKNTVSLDKDQVRHIAMLARLNLTDDEYAESVEKLSKIVDFVDQLSRADTEGVVPMAHPLDAVQRLRPDVVTETDDRDHFQENAPSVSGGLYLVPKVIE
jgi:aspartyl-tRNA(Asn)/glutamyl-tRNA(Gln) amidotransferase subunit C